MLSLCIPAAEFYDEATNLFLYTSETTIVLEHSLVSISKWESKWHKPFFSKEAKTAEETLDYIRCMTITKNVNPRVYQGMKAAQIDEVQRYIEEPMTATWFGKGESKTSSREVVTSEIIYYWMTALNIPFECEKWHINRLLTLIRVCNEKQKPPKKRSHRESMAKRWELNKARRTKLHTKG